MRAFLLSYFLLICFSGNAAVLTVSVVTTPASCYGPNGTVTATAQGGAPPYSYLWSQGANTFYVDGLLPGMYTVTVTDAVGATASVSRTVTGSPYLQGVNVLQYGNPVTGFYTLPCNAQCNGIAYLDESKFHGTPPYQFAIINSSNPNLVLTTVNGIQAISNICFSDSYQVIVTDSTGCSATAYHFAAAERSFDHQTVIQGACFGQPGSVMLNFSNLMATGLPTSALLFLSYSGPVSDSVYLFNPATLSNLLPGNYSINVSNYPIINCDTTILVTVPDYGNNCGVITGKVFLDTINNCLAEASEPVVPQQLIQFNPGPHFATSDLSGNYSIRLPYNTYSASLHSTPPLYPICNVSGLVLTAVNDTIANVDLGDSINITTELALGITSSLFRPGFSGNLYATIQNTSIDLVPYPQLDVYYDPQLTFQSAPYPPSVSVPGHLTFMLNAIGAFSSGNFNIQFLTPPNPALIGITINFTATITANIPEPDTTNNTDFLSVQVTGSLDPNDKTVDPSRDSLNSFYTNLDDEIQYRIRFQNTGNDTTFNVLVVDTLSAFLDPSTFRFIAASHPVQWEVTGQNVLKFHFNNILLPDSNTNETQSHGVIAFAIKPYVPVLTTTIENRADIYFDFNPAVLTNVVSSFITTSVGLNESPGKSNLRLVPNPAMDYISLNLPAGFDATSLQIYNLIGQEVLQLSAGSIVPAQRIDVSILSEGYYILKVQSVKGEQISGGLVIRH